METKGGNERSRRVGGRATHLLHDTSLPFREGNVATGLVLDELDLNLSTLATGLIVIVVVVLGAQTAAFGDVVVSGAVASSRGLLEVFVGGRRGILLTNGSDVGHGGQGREEWNRKSR